MTTQLAASGRAWRYTAPAIVFHWLLAIAIPAMMALGWYMMAIEETPSAPWYFDLHKSIGILVLATVMLRSAWRLFHRPAALPSHVATWQVAASKASHWLLYASMLAMPLFGLSGALLSEDGIAFFGLPITAVFTPNKPISEILFSLHAVTAWILVGLIAVHVLAATRHLLLAKDRIFQRMWF